MIFVVCGSVIADRNSYVYNCLVMCILTVYGFIVSSASALTRRAHRSQQRKCKRQFVAWTAKRRKINALQNVSKYKSNTQESANWPWTVSKLRMVEIN